MNNEGFVMMRILHCNGALVIFIARLRTELF